MSGQHAGAEVMRGPLVTTSIADRGVEPDDETLRPVARAVYDLFLAGDSDQCPGGIRATDVYSCDELERVLTVARAAIAAPVLVMHQPCHTTDGSGCSPAHVRDGTRCTLCRSYAYPCPTLRALGVTS